MRNEIVAVLRDRTMPELRDKDRLPYCMAVLFETFRYYTVSPLLVPHCVLEDTEIHGYPVKKNTNVSFVCNSKLHTALLPPGTKISPLNIHKFPSNLGWSFLEPLHITAAISFPRDK